MKWAIIAFPGTNCEEDTRYLLTEELGQDARVVWHQETRADADVLVLPGGFAHGDYLRCGAIARFSPIMTAVREHAEGGRPVLGICNGMQVLTEAGLLPGVLLRNDSLEYRCRWVHLRVHAADRAFLGDTPAGAVLRMPISHGEGRYHCSPEEAEAMLANGQVIVRYCDERGAVGEESNPNGSTAGIAGLRNARGNVFGLMPHPERACNPLLGGVDGLVIFRALIEAMNG
ncbi:MAG TPA: phosphoribosylformylglycinamidine synthase I [Chloroflexota bacterium]|nr:phosphoribosylformylglycinamidine synthase I [Chloroflexota bacterium]